jgi:hypothetical protein
MEDNTIVDITLLTQAQREMWSAYEQGFNSSFWKDIEARITALEKNVQQEYDACSGEQHLGRVQGARKSLLWILSLPDVIRNEFLLMTGQLGGGAETEVPAEAGDWRS